MKYIIVFIGILMLPFMSYSQKNFDTFSDSCKRNYSIYHGNLESKNYKDALFFWNETVRHCPDIRRSLWSDGEEIFKYKIINAKDPIKKEELIDSLMWVYDQRIKYFGDDKKYTEGYILGKKGVYLLGYRKNEVKLGYDILGKSIELQKLKSNPAVLLTYMQTSRQLFMDGLIDSEIVFNDYDKVIKIVDIVLESNPDDKDYLSAKEGIEQHFTKSGAADCETLSNLYVSKFENMKTDSSWLVKIVYQLKKTGCSDSDLFFNASEALFIFDPNVDDAFYLANLSLNMGDYDKASKYLEKSIELEVDDEKIASVYYQLALLNFNYFKKYEESRKLALMSIDKNPNCGEPYILIGQIYITVREDLFSDSFEQSTVFWAAVDKFIMAKNKDVSVKDKADKFIYQYSKYFPNNEDVFFRTLKDGDSYTVGGWINEKTTIRSNKL